MKQTQDGTELANVVDAEVVRFQQAGKSTEWIERYREQRMSSEVPTHPLLCERYADGYDIAADIINAPDQDSQRMRTSRANELWYEEFAFFYGIVYNVDIRLACQAADQRDRKWQAVHVCFEDKTDDWCEICLLGNLIFSLPFEQAVEAAKMNESGYGLIYACLTTVRPQAVRLVRVKEDLSEEFWRLHNKVGIPMAQAFEIVKSKLLMHKI